MPKFSNLKAGEIFEAYGVSFQKLPLSRGADLLEVNAINLETRQPAFFGPTVLVELKHQQPMEHSAGEKRETRLVGAGR